MIFLMATIWVSLAAFTISKVEPEPGCEKQEQIDDIEKFEI